MARNISLAPAGLVVERLETTADKITVLARPTWETAGQLGFPQEGIPLATP